MSYFKSVPNILYPDLLDKTKLVLAKNFFRKVRLREDVSTAPLFFTKYTIQDGESPDLVADKLYNNPTYFWIILIVNNITNINKEWPVSNNTLQETLFDKYENPYAVKHYETIKLYNDNGELIQEDGLIVTPSSYKLRYYNPTTDEVETLTNANGILKEVSYADYELELNDEKREITYLKRRYLSKFIDEFEQRIAYDTSYGIDKKGRKLPNV